MPKPVEDMFVNTILAIYLGKDVEYVDKMLPVVLQEYGLGWVEDEMPEVVSALAFALSEEYRFAAEALAKKIWRMGKRVMQKQKRGVNKAKGKSKCRGEKEMTKIDELLKEIRKLRKEISKKRFTKDLVSMEKWMQVKEYDKKVVVTYLNEWDCSWCEEPRGTVDFESSVGLEVVEVGEDYVDVMLLAGWGSEDVEPLVRVRIYHSGIVGLR